MDSKGLSRYDLQRIYRRSLAKDRKILAVARVVEFKAAEAFRQAADVLSHHCLDFLLNFFLIRPGCDECRSCISGMVLRRESSAVRQFESNASYPSSVMRFSTDTLVEDLAPESEFETGFMYSSDSNSGLVNSYKSLFYPTVDDRRALLDACLLGDIRKVAMITQTYKLKLDGRIIADAFCKTFFHAIIDWLCFLNSVIRSCLGQRRSIGIMHH
jgi:hypothetical protein